MASPEPHRPVTNSGHRRTPRASATHRARSTRGSRASSEARWKVCPLDGGVRLWCSLGGLQPGLPLNRRIPMDPRLPPGFEAADPRRLAAEMARSARLRVHGDFVFGLALARRALALSLVEPSRFEVKLRFENSELGHGPTPRCILPATPAPPTLSSTFAKLRRARAARTSRSCGAAAVDVHGQALTLTRRARAPGPAAAGSRARSASLRPARPRRR